ncbi:MAG: T9SS type A sorting domain-containing protein [Bacteroidales bacterium]
MKTTSGQPNILNGVSAMDADHVLIVGETGTMIMKNEGAFSSPLTRIFSKSADSLKLSTSELFFGLKYYWKLRGIHETDTTEWSTAKYFSTIANPVNVAPTNNATGQMIDLTVEWEVVPGVFEYIVELCDDPDFSTPCMYFSDENTFTPQGLLFDKTYYWHVKSAHTQDTSSFSPTWSFETLNKVNLVSPANGSHVGETFATLTWQPLSGLSGVQVYYDTDQNFPMPEIVDLEGAVSSYKIPFMLVDDETYYWKVRAYEDGDTTNWSDTWSFIMGEVGINEINKHNVKLFPNPNNGVLNIEVDGNVQGDVYFSISNVLGEIILNEKYIFAPGVNNRRIDLGDFENGMYIVQFKSGKSVYTQKVILDR